MRAFDLGRVFMYKWSVNWKFVSEDLFLDRSFHASLLLLHLTVLITFAFRKYATYVIVVGFKMIFY